MKLLLNKNILYFIMFIVAVNFAFGNIFDFISGSAHFYSNFQYYGTYTLNFIMIIIYSIIYSILTLKEVTIRENGIDKKYRYNLLIILISLLTFGDFVTFQMVFLGNLVMLLLLFMRDKEVKLDEMLISIVCTTTTIGLFNIVGGKASEINFPINFFAVIFVTTINYFLYTTLQIFNNNMIKKFLKVFKQEYLWIIKYDLMQSIYGILVTNTAFVFLYNNLALIQNDMTSLGVEKIVYLLLWIFINIFIFWFLIHDKLNSFKTYIKSNVENINNITTELNEAIIIIDNNYEIKFKNPAAATMFENITTIDAIIEKLQKDSTNDIDVNFEIKNFINKKENNKFELKYKNKNAYEVLMSLEKNKYSETTGFVIVIYDVTEHERLLEELKDKEAQLLISEKMAVIGQITAGVAHEINTPLGSIKSNVDMEKMLIPSIESEDIKEAMNSLNDINVMAIDRIMEIVKGLKNFARLDESMFKEANLNEGIESTLMLITGQLKDINLAKNFGNIRSIKCYPQQLNQVFLNILVNSVQAMNKQEKNIEISTFEDDNFINICFKDNGCGISKDKLEKIFEPGYTTKGVGVGTGLGLAISYKIIENHKGKIEVESEEGSYTKFTIKLPLEGINE